MSGGFLALQQKKSKEKRKVVDLEDAFKVADTDKDGRLSLDEWVDVLKSTGHSITRYYTFLSCSKRLSPISVKHHFGALQLAINKIAFTMPSFSIEMLVN